MIKKLHIISENAPDMTANAIIMTQSQSRTIKRNHIREELGDNYIHHQNQMQGNLARQTVKSEGSELPCWYMHT